MAPFWRRWYGDTPSIDNSQAERLEQLRDSAPIPCLWLFGKTGSGKSSIIRCLTGAENAAIGDGYRPETRTSRRYDFPNAENPLMSFLDTRGLAEASYDPSEDITRFSSSTHLLIVTVRVSDHALQPLIEPLRRIRKASPETPTLLVLTCLHEVTGSVDLSDGDDPFAADGTIDDPQRIPADLRMLLEAKRSQFEGLFDAVIPVDLTQIEDGFADPNFGSTRLQQAILNQLPHAYRQALLGLQDAGTTSQSDRQRQSRLQVLASSAMAATAGAVPVPWVDIPAVLGIQTHLAIKIAGIYEQEITPARWAVLSSAAGSRIALRLAIRGALKFIPMVGMAVGAATSFAFTYAMGMSWDWYFADLRRGNVPTADQLQEVFSDQLRRGRELWKAK
jgi:uncharacterized protein (DUF697 family)